MSLSFPRELYDEVLSHLASDSAALRNAALVCHYWTEPSQTVLFASVSLEANYSVHKLESRTSNLLRSLQAAPHLAAYVRILSIALRSTQNALILPDKANIIATILPLLPRISTISLHADHIDDRMIAAMGEMALNAPLSAIDLPYAVFSSFSDFIRILPPNLCLRSLEIGRLIIQDTMAPPSIEAAPVIHSLTLDRCVTALPRLAAWMFAHPIAVHDFRLVDCGGQSSTVIAILNAIAPSVVKLDLDLMQGVPPTQIVFPELRSVKYRLDTASITPPRPASEHTAFLASFEAPKLEELTLCFHRYHTHLKITAVDFTSLGRIDEHLGHAARFPGLRQFNVELWELRVVPRVSLPEQVEAVVALNELARVEDRLVPTLNEFINLGTPRDTFEKIISSTIARKMAYNPPLPPLPANVSGVSETEDETTHDSATFFLSLYPEFPNMLTRGLWSASVYSRPGIKRMSVAIPLSCEDILKQP
ncbi:hypothetical protein C8R46DRAFT_1352766 [Mycena filopes]|nr:hypothetical protein C8R46DRAFT_1352766 [Mycena filopes]